MSNSQKVVILLGPPGAGKGTQASLLSERDGRAAQGVGSATVALGGNPASQDSSTVRVGSDSAPAHKAGLQNPATVKMSFYYLETSKIIESKINGFNKGDYLTADGEKYYFEKEKELWESGKLCSPPFVVKLIKNKIKELKKSEEGLVLAGSPRTLYEGKKLTPLLRKLYGKENIRIILLKVSEKQSIFRNSHRRICELVRHPILYNKETQKLTKCPLDGSKLISRKLDNPQTIKERLKEYKKRTLPLVDYFENNSFEVNEIDGSQPVADVFEDVLKALK